MPINQVCPVQNKPYKVPDAAVGQKVRCPFCQTIYVAGPGANHPAVTSSQKPATPPRTAAAAPKPAPPRAVPSAAKPLPAHPPTNTPAAARPQFWTRKPAILAAAVGAVVLVTVLLIALLGRNSGLPVAEAKDKPGEHDDVPRLQPLPDPSEPKKGAGTEDTPKTPKQDPGDPAPPNPNIDTPPSKKLSSPPDDCDVLFARLQIESIDKVLDNVNSLLETARRPDVLKQTLQSLPLKSSPDLDTKKPLGAYLEVRPGADPLRFVVLLPIRSKETFLHALNQPDTPGPDGNWHLIVPDLKQKASLRFAHGYVYLTIGEDHPSADAHLLKPSQVFAPPGDNLISAVARLDRLPRQFRGMSAAEMTRAAAPLQGSLLAGMSKAQAAFAERVIEALIGLQADFVAGSKEATLSLEMSPASGQLAVQLQLGAEPNSNLARMIQAIGDMPSLFGELAEGDAAFRFMLHVRMSEELRKLWAPVAQEITDKVLQDDSDPVALKEAKGIFKALQPTIAAAEINLAMALLSDGKLATVLGGIKAPSSRQLESVLQQKVSELRDPTDRAVYQWDAARVDEVKVHRLAVGKMLPPQLQMFGQNDFCLAFRDDALFWAAGRNVMSSIQRGVRGRPKPAAPLQFDMNVKMLMDLLPLDEASKAGARKHLTVRNPGRIRLSLEGGDNLRLRLSLDLSLVAAAMESVQIQI